MTKAHRKCSKYIKDISDVTGVDDYENFDLNVRHCRLVNFPLGKLNVWDEKGVNDGHSQNFKSLEPYKEEKPIKVSEEYDDEAVDPKTQKITKTKKKIT